MTRFLIRKTGFAKPPLCLITGLLVLKSGKPNLLWNFAGTKPDFRFKTSKKPDFWRLSKLASRLRKPASRIASCCSRVHIWFIGFQIQKTGFGFLQFCSLTGLPVRKSSKPDSCPLKIVHLPLLFWFSVSVLSL